MFFSVNSRVCDLADTLDFGKCWKIEVDNNCVELFDDYFLSFPAYFDPIVLPFQSLYPLFNPVFECKDVSFSFNT